MERNRKKPRAILKKSCTTRKKQGPMEQILASKSFYLRVLCSFVYSRGRSYPSRGEGVSLGLWTGPEDRLPRACPARHLVLPIQRLSRALGSTEDWATPRSACLWGQRTRVLRERSGLCRRIESSRELPRNP